MVTVELDHVSKIEGHANLNIKIESSDNSDKSDKLKKKPFLDRL